jgi:hypothetical protein
MRPALLVTNEYVLEARLDALHRVVDLDDGASGVAEDGVHALGVERMNEYLGAGHCGRRRGGSVSGRVN